MGGRRVICRCSYLYRKMDMTEDQKRELTERIAKWLGEDFLISKGFRKTEYGFEKGCEYCNGYEVADRPFDPLTSRDDWALVEEEIERRGLWVNYIESLVRLSGSKESLLDSFWAIRRASPFVCVQAWDEMVKEWDELVKELEK